MAIQELALQIPEKTIVTKDPSRVEGRGMYLDKYFRDSKGYYFITERGDKFRPVDIQNGNIVFMDFRGPITAAASIPHPTKHETNKSFKRKKK
jgi:hypothetical protein